MEVKDINSQNSVVAMFRKMTSNVGAFEFASLISNNESNVVSTSKPVSTVIEQKMPETATLKEASTSRRDEANVVRKDNEKPAKANKRKDKDVIEENTTPVAQNKVEHVETKETPVVQKDTTTVNADTVQENVVETTNVAVDDVAVNTTSVANVTVPAIDSLMLDNIALLGDVNYFDVASGTMIKATGAELVQAIATNQIENFNPANITTLEGTPVFAELANNIQSSTQSSEGIDISMLESVEPEEMPELLDVVSKKTTASTSLASTVLETTADTEVELAEIVPTTEETINVEDKKIKLDVKVTTGEEKISYSARQEMFADNLAVTEAVAKSVNSENNTDNSPITMASQNSPITTAQSANILPQGVAVQATMENITSVTTGAAVSSVDGTSNLATASLNNGFIAQNKNAVHSPETKSHVEDIFKGMSREVIEQVKVNITKSAIKGVDKIDISLKPEDLGHIEIKMQLSKDGKLQAHIISSRPETMEILQKDMQSLQKAFADAGFQTDDNSLSFSFQDNNQTWQQQREEENGLRRFMGNIFESESGNDNLSQTENVWDGKSALNIRV